MTTLDVIACLTILLFVGLYWKIDIPLATLVGTVSGVVLGGLYLLNYWAHTHFEATIRLTPDHEAILVPYVHCLEGADMKNCLDQALSRINGGFEAVTFLMVMTDYGLVLEKEQMSILQMRGTIDTKKVVQGVSGE